MGGQSHDVRLASAPNESTAGDEAQAKACCSGCCGACGTGTVPMDDAQIDEHMKTLEGWKLSDDRSSLEASFKFSNRQGPTDAVVSLVNIAEGLDHDADTRTCFCTMTLTLTTHSAGCKLTEKDFEFAQAVNRIAPMWQTHERV